MVSKDLSGQFQSFKRSVGKKVGLHSRYLYGFESLGSFIIVRVCGPIFTFAGPSILLQTRLNVYP